MHGVVCNKKHAWLTGTMGLGVTVTVVVDHVGAGVMSTDDVLISVAWTTCVLVSYMVVTIFFPLHKMGTSDVSVCVMVVW